MSNIGGTEVCLGPNDRSIGHIEEIMVNILSKLPAKHMVRCKVVSKMFNDLISGQHFSKLHFSCSRKNPKLIAYNHDYFSYPVMESKLCLIEVNGRVEPFVTYPYMGLPSKLVCSFNGLIICTTGILRGQNFQIYICNPVTRELQVLPDGSPSVVLPRVRVVFDPKNHKYKVLRFFVESVDSPVINYKCETYDPNTRTWTKFSNVPCPLGDMVYSLLCYYSHVNAGGRMYWFARSFSTVPKYILSVDTEDNFTRIELPEYPMDSATFNECTYLVELEDQLLLISVEKRTDKYLYIWSLKNHPQPFWFYVGSVRHELLQTYTICSITSVKNEILFVVNPKGGAHILYRMLNMNNMTWREVQFKEEFKSYYIFPFTESLFKCDLTG